MYLHHNDLKWFLWCFSVFFAKYFWDRLWYFEQFVHWLVKIYLACCVGWGAASASCPQFSHCNSSCHFHQAANYAEILLHFLSQNHHRSFQLQKKLDCKLIVDTNRFDLSDGRNNSLLKNGSTSLTNFRVYIFFAVKNISLSFTRIFAVAITSQTAWRMSLDAVQALKKYPILVWHHEIKWMGWTSKMDKHSSRSSLFLILDSKCFVTVRNTLWSSVTSSTSMVFEVVNRFATPLAICAAHR